ncbi:MAG TPA: hypothetical protein VIU93_02570 [Gallionellaceae bacterium]
MSYISEAAIWLLIALLLGVMAWGIIDEASSPAYQLNKAKWQCVKEDPVTYSQPVGKVVMPVVHMECTEYRRVAN